MNDLLTTAEAARIAGVGVTSIKRWADQALIRVTQTPGGHRRVLRHDLERFLAESSNGRRVRSAESKGSSRPAFSEADVPNRWADIMLSSDVYSIQGALLEARGRTGSWHAASDEATHGLAEIGRRWESGMLSALEEHIASENLSLALGMLMTVFPRSSGDSTCLLTCPEGEIHTLGLSFLQLCLREAGWATMWVGAGVPVRELCATASSGEVSMIAMSASMASQDEAHLTRTASQVGAACALSGTKLVLGGQGAWPEVPPFGRRFHAFTPFNKYIASL